MLDPEFSIRNEFPPVGFDTWRALAEASLQGASFEQELVTSTYEGIDLQPLYSCKDRLGEDNASGLPGSPPFVRGSSTLGAVLSGWDLRQEHATPQPAAANEAILGDIQGGVTSLLLVLDRAACSGFDPDDERADPLADGNGLMVYHVDDLDQALAGVDLSLVGISLEAGAAFLPAAALLASLWRRRQVPAEEARGAFNADPLSVLARDGTLPLSMEAALTQMSDLAAWTSETYPQATAVGVDTSPYHHAGASETQDLAFAMATAVQYLRTMTDSGMGIDVAAKQILFRISLGTHHFLSIAKLRAARRLWSRVVEASGGSPGSAAMRIHARLSNRVLTRHDPYVNLLRNTTSIFAAGLGGADAITSIPLDYVCGQSNDFSRRVARNTALILQEEAQLHRVIDPAGGSWFLETLTDQVAIQAWDIFQQVECQGGMLQALESGWIAEQVDSIFARRASDVASRKKGIIGVSEFPNLVEPPCAHPVLEPPESQADAVRRIQSIRGESIPLPSISSTADAVEAATNGATLGQLADALGFHQESTTITPLVSRRLAEGFEELREASDLWQISHGHRPRVFLANMGTTAHYTARATYSTSFFEVGGFEVISGVGFQDADTAAKGFLESGAAIAVICSSDKLYPEFVPEVTPKLKAAGARTVVLAGKPGPNEQAWREAGVDRFIFTSCDVVATLRELLAEEGVLER